MNGCIVLIRPGIMECIAKGITSIEAAEQAAKDPAWVDHAYVLGLLTKYFLRYVKEMT
jgi:hypothetical protein